MALDLIPARHERDIHAAQRRFAIDQALHAQLQARAQPPDDYPLLRALRYHDDTAFPLAELRALHAELLRVETRFTEPSQVRELLCFVERTIADGDNLYATAD
ncbi:hypothetical protein [Lysobacter silvisoli]|uniref:Uncharacterized protein n=1 Tax=Lysobacter silvisoli TaxID=2293254 RepID=A0A371K5F8_9GAMM|nr:hypothetical protein [Lysobacter silvisoli]RDZ29092.1 hypothetical protein DX914_08345 [Lysobacter silvisoli]